MSNCKEFLLDDLLAVVTIPVEDFPVGNSAWQLLPTIPSGAFAPVYTHAITIGQKAVAAGTSLIPILQGTGRAKDSESDSVAGRIHTVTIQCEADSRDNNIWSLLLSLERSPRHLLLTFRNNQQAFVQASEDTYECSVERDGSKTSITFKIQCMMGIQLIV